jgi:hypothetical protein
MPYLLIRVASFIPYVMLLMCLHLYYDPYLSLNACIHFFIKLALLIAYIITISHPVCGLDYVSLNLHMRVYILSAI